jgi:hypothetical protein
MERVRTQLPSSKYAPAESSDSCAGFGLHSGCSPPGGAGDILLTEAQCCRRFEKPSPRFRTALRTLVARSFPSVSVKRPCAVWARSSGRGAAQFANP